METSTDFLPDPAATARINRIKLLREIEQLQKTEERKSTWLSLIVAAGVTTVFLMGTLPMIVLTLRETNDSWHMLSSGGMAILCVLFVASTWLGVVHTSRDVRWIKVAELLQILAKEVAELKAEK